MMMETCLGLRVIFSSSSCISSLKSFQSAFQLFRNNKLPVITATFQPNLGLQHIISSLFPFSFFPCPLATHYFRGCILHPYIVGLIFMRIYDSANNKWLQLDTGTKDQF